MKKWTITQECIARLNRVIIVEGETREDAEEALIEGNWIDADEEMNGIISIETENWQSSV